MKNIVLTYLVLIYDHTLLFKSLELYFVFTYQKKICWKNIYFKKIFKNQFWPSTGRLCGRPLAEQNCSIGRPGGQPTCTMCKRAHRSTGPIDRLQEQCSLFVPVDRPSRPIESFTFCLGTTVDRPVDRQQKILHSWLRTARFNFVFCWVLSQRIYCIYSLVFIPYK